MTTEHKPEQNLPQRQTEPIKRAAPPPKLEHPYEPPEKPWNVPKKVTEAGELPRIIHQMDRAAPGTSRVKVRVGEKPMLYILTQQGKETDAVPFYAEKNGMTEAEVHGSNVFAKILND